MLRLRRLAWTLGSCRFRTRFKNEAYSVNIFILANVLNDFWKAQRSGFLANDYVDGARECGVLLPTLPRMWMARTCGSLASTNVPYNYVDIQRERGIFLPTRRRCCCYANVANVLNSNNTMQTDASSRTWGEAHGHTTRTDASSGKARLI